MARPNICANKPAAIGERTELSPQANSTARGCVADAGIAPSPLPVQHRDQREQPPRRVEIELDLALEPLHEDVRGLVVQGAAAHVERLDAVRRRGADRRVVAVADHEIILHDPAERRQREEMRDYRRTVALADIEHQPAAVDAEIERIRPTIVTHRAEAVLFDQIIDGDRALMLDVGARSPDRGFIERHRDEAAGLVLASLGSGHQRLSRMATERAWAWRPSASPSVMAASASARNCSGPHLRIEVRFMKSSTPSPEEKRADRAVGST